RRPPTENRAAFSSHGLGVARLYGDRDFGLGQLPGDHQTRQIADQEQIARVQIELEAPGRAESGVRRQGELLTGNAVVPPLDRVRNVIGPGLRDVAPVRSEGKCHPASRVVDFPDAEIPALTRTLGLRLAYGLQNSGFSF